MVVCCGVWCRALNIDVEMVSPRQAEDLWRTFLRSDDIQVGMLRCRLLTNKRLPPTWSTKAASTPDQGLVRGTCRYENEFDNTNPSDQEHCRASCVLVFHRPGNPSKSFIHAFCVQNPSRSTRHGCSVA